MQNPIQYYIHVFLPQCKAADDKRRAKPRHPSCYEVRTCCEIDGSSPVPWEHRNEDKLRTCQINISQMQQLLTDPNRSTNRAHKPMRAHPQRQKGSVRLLHPSIRHKWPQPQWGWAGISFKHSASHPSSPSWVVLYVGQSSSSTPPPQSPVRARWGTSICQQLQTLYLQKEAEANLIMHLPSKSPPRNTNWVVTFGHVQLLASFCLVKL